MHRLSNGLGWWHFANVRYSTTPPLPPLHTSAHQLPYGVRAKPTSVHCSKALRTHGVCMVYIICDVSDWHGGVVALLSTAPGCSTVTMWPLIKYLLTAVVSRVSWIFGRLVCSFWLMTNSCTKDLHGVQCLCLQLCAWCPANFSVLQGNEALWSPDKWLAATVKQFLGSSGYSTACCLVLMTT